jgi:PAS domain-containing protein
MYGSAEREGRGAGTPTAVLTGAVADAIRAADGFAGGIYLRSSTPSLLRLAVLAGLPGRLFRPWSRLHLDLPFPAADAFRLGVPVILADPTETMRRYPQLAAGLPFRFGSAYVPVVGGATTYGVLTVLRPSAPDVTESLPDRDRLTAVADELGAALRSLEDDGIAIAWDEDTLCVRPPAVGTHSGRIGRFTWDPEGSLVTADDTLLSLSGGAKDDIVSSPEALAEAVAPDDAHLVLAALRETATGRPPAGPLRVRAADGGPRLLELWIPAEPPVAPDPVHRVSGLVIDPGPGPAADGAADLLPDGVFAIDRLGLVTYVNPRAAELLGRSRVELLGRPLWEGAPWLDRPEYEDHLRAALLSPEPVHFQV